jgi:hypothetical protein
MGADRRRSLVEEQLMSDLTNLSKDEWEMAMAAVLAADADGDSTGTGPDGDNDADDQPPSGVYGVPTQIVMPTKRGKRKTKRVPPGQEVETPKDGMIHKWHTVNAGADEFDTGITDNPAMADGSFLILNEGSLRAAINKVQAADELYSTGNRHLYLDVKAHIARRASELGLSDLVPAGWKETASLAAEAEMAKSFSDEKRKDLAKKGLALPDGSYPIESKGDLSNAMQAYGRAKPADRAKVKAHLLKRARALGASPAVIGRIMGLGK